MTGKHSVGAKNNMERAKNNMERDLFSWSYPMGKGKKKPNGPHDKQEMQSIFRGFKGDESRGKPKPNW